MARKMQRTLGHSLAHNADNRRVFGSGAVAVLPGHGAAFSRDFKRLARFTKLAINYTLFPSTHFDIVILPTSTFSHQIAERCMSMVGSFILIPKTFSSILSSH